MRNARGSCSRFIYYAIGSEWYRIDTKNNELHVLVNEEWHRVENED